MASLKEKFLEGCAANGLALNVAKQLWDDMEKAQDYSFNKSHAACYALIAYRTGLPAREPPARVHGRADLVRDEHQGPACPLYVNACHEMGIEVEPPDVNCSQTDFAVVAGKIRFGLNAVKNVGEGAARAIIAAREEGGEFDVDLGLHRAGRPGSREQARARVARQVRRARLHRRVPHGDADRARGRARLGPAPPRRPALRPGLDLRGARRGRRRDAPRSTTRRCRRSRTTRPSACAGRRRRSASTSRSTRSTASATSSGARPTAGWRRWSAAATARSSRSAGSSARSSS